MKKTIKARSKTKNRIAPVRGLARAVAKVEEGVIRKDLPDFGPGDTVKVHVRVKEGEKERIQIFEGVVLGRAHHGASKSFTVRKSSHGVGVERVFLDASPRVAKVEVAQEGKVRRAKLYYLRKLQGKAARIERDLESGSAGETPATKPAASASSNPAPSKA